MYIVPEPVMWDAAMDYVRLTLRGGSDATTIDVYQPYARAALALSDDQNITGESWNWMGYRGTNYGLVQVGAGHQGAILQATQWAAQRLAELKPPWDNVARCDAQVTLWYDQDRGDMIRELAEAVVARRNEGRGRPVSVRHINGYGKGDTTYVGTRNSSKLLRAYDKYREQGEGPDYQYAIRLEMEYHNEAACDVWASPPGYPHTRHSVAAIVGGALQNYGIGLAAPELANVHPLARHIARKASEDSRIAWLATQVRPAIDKLIAKGYDPARLRRDLGLD